MPLRPGSPSTRRTFLAGVGTVLGAGVAGCLGDTSTTGNRGTRETSTTSATAASTATASTREMSIAGETTDPTTTDGETIDPTTITDGTEGTTGTKEKTGSPIHPGYETTEVRVTTRGGDPLGRVTAAVADTPELRYTGLGDTGSLPEDRGMLFVYGSVDDRTFVMRGMDFGLDIVFADAEGVITAIHHAPAPGPDEDGSQQRYPGRGQYVLEVNYGWTTDRGVEAGHVLDFEL